MLKLSDHGQKTSHGMALRRCQVSRGNAGGLFGLLMWWFGWKNEAVRGGGKHTLSAARDSSSEGSCYARLKFSTFCIANYFCP
jgi:hypothetical protein